jgi:hypothetical protein
MVVRDEPEASLIQVSENAKARLRDFGWTDDKIQAVLGKPKRGDQTELAPGSDRDGSHRALAKPRQLG